MKKPITVQSHLSFEAAGMRYPEPISWMDPGDSGAHHRLRCLAGIRTNAHRYNHDRPAGIDDRRRAYGFEER
jgi:hypothetical protein